MFELFDFLEKISDKAWQVIIIVILAAICLYLLKVLLSSFLKKIEENTATNASWSNQVQAQLSSVKTDIDDHKDAMGKATKAINGDFLKIKESVLDLRSEIVKESLSMKNGLNEFKSELLLASQRAQFVSDSLAEKTGKIILVEKNMAKVMDDSKRHEDMLSKIVKVVNTNINDIKILKKGDDT